MKKIILGSLLATSLMFASNGTNGLNSNGNGNQYGIYKQMSQDSSTTTSSEDLLDELLRLLS